MSDRQVKAFGELFLRTDLALFQTAMDGGLRDSPLRGVAWRFFLGALSGPPGNWAEQIQSQVVDFDNLCVKHCVDPSAAADAEDADLAIANPLSTAEESPFNKFFASSAMREQIDQDLARLYPGDTFVARPEVQRLMHRILFIWASSHPEISYRQGMHELLAPLLMTAWSEAEEAEDSAATREAASLETPEGTGTGDSGAVKEAANAASARTLLAEVLTLQTVEATTWALFSQLMRAAGEFFEPGTRLPPAVEPPTTPLLRMCTHIQSTRLAASDPSLHARVVALGLEPQLYLLRWLRGRGK